MLYRFVFGIVHDLHTSENIVQEVFVRILPCMHPCKDIKHVQFMEVEDLRYSPTNNSVLKETTSCVENIFDIATKPTPIVLPPSLPSNKPNSLSQAPLFTELAYLTVLCEYTLPAVGVH